MQPGRDHWGSAMSMIVAGGNMRTGQIIGATNSKGEYPVERPLTLNDLWATVYQHLGIDYTQNFLDHQGRPMPILPFGGPLMRFCRWVRRRPLRDVDPRILGVDILDYASFDEAVSASSHCFFHGK